MFTDEHEEVQVSYWPSVSDLFMTLFIISLVIIGALYSVLIPRQIPGGQNSILEAVGLDLRHIREPVNRMRLAVQAPLLRQTQPPAEIVAGLSVTSDDVVKKLENLGHRELELLSKIKLQEQETERLKKLLSEASEREKGLLRDSAHWKIKAESAEKALNDKPPIIKIDEATKQYKFASGSAVMTEDFKRGLSEREFKILASEIEERNKAGANNVDTLLVVGHTDGKPVSPDGNLDQRLPAYLSGMDSNLAQLSPGSNNDLGLLRALALRQAWNEFVAEHPNKGLLKSITVCCYSAGQTVPVNGDLTDSATYQLNDEKFRRIEILLTKLGIQ